MRIPKWEYVCWGSLGTILIFGVVAWLWTVSGGDDLLSAADMVPDESDTLELVDPNIDIDLDANNSLTIESAHGPVVISWDANGLQVTGDPNAFPLAAHTFFMEYVYKYMKAYYDVRQYEMTQWE